MEYIHLRPSLCQNRLFFVYLTEIDWSKNVIPSMWDLNFTPSSDIFVILVKKILESHHYLLK